MLTNLSSLIAISCENKLYYTFFFYCFKYHWKSDVKKSISKIIRSFSINKCKHYLFIIQILFQVLKRFVFINGVL